MQALRQIEGLGTEFKTFRRVFREQQDVTGVAVRRIGARQQVGLLGASRHASRWPAALDIENHRRNFGEKRQPEKFLHQRNTGTRSRGEGARAVPAGTDHHADGSKFILCLDNSHTTGTIGVGAVFAAITGEGLDDRGRRRDRIPRCHGSAAIDGTEPAGAVAIDKYTIANFVRPFQPQAERAGQVCLRVVVANPERIDIGARQFFLAGKLLPDQFFQLGDIHVEQRRQCADIHDVFEQLTLPRIGVLTIAHLGERDAEDVEVIAKA